MEFECYKVNEPSVVWVSEYLCVCVRVSWLSISHRLWALHDTNHCWRALSLSVSLSRSPISISLCMSVYERECVRHAVYTDWYLQWSFWPFALHFKSTTNLVSMVSVWFRASKQLLVHQKSLKRFILSFYTSQIRQNQLFNNQLSS